MENKTMPITGGCLCGAVRYEAHEPPLRVAYCHCRRCQRAYGNLFGTFASFRIETFRYTRGEPRFYRSSAWAERGFCPTCGTPLVFLDATDTLGVLVGSLDHPEHWPPVAGHHLGIESQDHPEHWPPVAGHHLGIESQIPWLRIDDDLPRWRTEDYPEYRAAKAAAERGEG